MSYVVRMPQLGMSMEEGDVIKWTVSVNNHVEEGEQLVVVESEKATNEVESRETGVLRRILVPEGHTVEPGDPIGVVAQSDESIDHLLEEIELPAIEEADRDVAEPADANGVATRDNHAGTEVPEENGSDVRATPGARRRAEEEGVRIAFVSGTGPQGVVTKDDVVGHTSSIDSTSTQSVSADPRATPGAQKLAEEENIDLTGLSGTGPQGVVTEDDVRARLEAVGDKSTGAAKRTVRNRRTLSRIQSTISDRLGDSYRNAVHVTLNRSFDAETLASVRTAADQAGVQVSVEDVILKTVAKTLDEQPEFNALFEDGEHKIIAEVNLGIAVDVADGLVTPVLPDVGQKSVEEINRIRTQLTERAQSGELTPDELSGGTFTVSNLGVFGVDSFDPIIDPPQVAILGLGRIRENGTMTLSLSFDHRVVNGADAARFLDAVVETFSDETSLMRFFDIAIPTHGTELKPRTVRVETDSTYSGRYQTAHGDVSFDEPESVGGSGSAPSPVDGLLGALGSCLSVSVREMARRDQVDVKSLNCKVVGSPDHGPLESVDVTVQIEANVEDDVIERILTKAERACYVARSLSNDIDVELEWTRIRE